MIRRRSGASRFLTSLTSLVLLVSSRIFSPSCLSSLSVWRRLEVENYISPVTSQISSVFAPCELSNFCLRASRDFGGPGRTSWQASYLEFLRGVWDVSVFRRQGVVKRFTEESFLHLWTHNLYSLWGIVEISTPIGLPIPPRRNFLGIFPRCFSDSVNILFPYQRTIFYPIMFVLVVPDKTAKVMCDSADLKPVAQSKPFSGFKIIRMNE